MVTLTLVSNVTLGTTDFLIVYKKDISNLGDIIRNLAQIDIELFILLNFSVNLRR